MKKLCLVFLLAASVLLAACGSSESSGAEGSNESGTAREAMTVQEMKDMVVELPPEGYDGKLSSVKYPEFKKYTYFSTTAGRDTPVNVMMPAEPEEGKKYPVLYILHGYYDNEDWMASPRVNIGQMIGNLQRLGQAEEMIIVLPYIFCSKDLPTCTGMDDTNSLAYDNFINDLETDLMPYIEENFPAAEGRENRAITGFSMGGRESLFIGMKHPEQFGYIGAVCPAPGLTTQIAESEMKFPEGEKPYALLISSSKADNVVGGSPDSYRQAFTKNGEDFISHVMGHTQHDPSSVKPHLYNFLRMVFR